MIRPCGALLCIVIVLTSRCSPNTNFVESIGAEMKRQLWIKVRERRQKRGSKYNGSCFLFLFSQSINQVFVMQCESRCGLSGVSLPGESRGGERHLWVGGVADVCGGELLTLSGETEKPDSPRIKVSPTELRLGSAVNTVRRDK